MQALNTQYQILIAWKKRLPNAVSIGLLWVDATFWKSVCCAICVLWLAVFAPQALAAESSGSGGIKGRLQHRQAEREDERWFFSDYLASKQKSQRLDLLYRLYTAPGQGKGPRVEPYFYGLGSAGSERTDTTSVTGAESQTSSSSAAVRTAGYGGVIYFNNFVSGLTGFSTVNIVPGVSGERREESLDSGKRVALIWGPGVRLFAKNQQDSGLFLNYRNIRRQAFGMQSQAWLWEAGAKLYLMPALCLEGQAFFNESFLRGKPWSMAKIEGSAWGGYFEFQMIRIGLKSERMRLVERNAAPMASVTSSESRAERRTIIHDLRTLTLGLSL